MSLSIHNTTSKPRAFSFYIYKNDIFLLFQNDTMLPEDVVSHFLLDKLMSLYNISLNLTFYPGENIMVPPGIRTLAEIFFHDRLMPCCGNEMKYYLGPSGGLCQNIKCFYCDQCWNICPNMQKIEKIHDPKPFKHLVKDIH